MKRADYEHDDINDFFNDLVVEEVCVPISKTPSTRTIPTGRIAAIERAIRVQNWDEARRLASRADIGDEI